MIDRNHPAVNAARSATLGPPDDNQCWLSRTVAAALPNLTADDLRDTPAGQQLIREGQEQGWTECADHVALHAAGLGHTMLSKNPYKETP